MSELVSNATEESAPDVQEPRVFDAEYVAALRKESAKYRTEAKANADAAKRLAEIEQRDMSEIERSKKAAEDAENRLRDLELQNLRQTVVIAKGLSAELGERLRGDTREELEADADALMALLGDRRMQPDFSQGAHSPAPMTPEQEFLAFTSKL